MTTSWKFNPFTDKLDITDTSSSPTGDVSFLTGNSGGAVPPDASGNINVIGSNTQGINIVGVPGTNTLTASGIDATTTQKGILTLATNAEAIAGTDTVKALTSDDLKAKLGTQTLNGIGYGSGTSSAVSWTPVGTNGQVLIAATGAAPAFSTLTSPDNSITFATGANSLNLQVSGGTYLKWIEVITTSQVMTANNGYVANNAGLVTITLPVSAPFGTMVAVLGKGAGGWRIAQLAGQQILIGTQSTTAGVGGHLDSSNTRDSIFLLCTTTTTTWTAITAWGNISIT